MGGLIGSHMDTALMDTPGLGVEAASWWLIDVVPLNHHNIDDVFPSSRQISHRGF